MRQTGTGPRQAPALGAVHASPPGCKHTGTAPPLLFCCLDATSAASSVCLLVPAADASNPFNSFASPSCRSAASSRGSVGTLIRPQRPYAGAEFIPPQRARASRRRVGTMDWHTLAVVEVPFARRMRRMRTQTLIIWATLRCHAGLALEMRRAAGARLLRLRRRRNDRPRVRGAAWWKSFY